MEKSAQAKLKKKKNHRRSMAKNYRSRPHCRSLHHVCYLKARCIPDCRERDEHPASDVRRLHHVLWYDHHHHQCRC